MKKNFLNFWIFFLPSIIIFYFGLFLSLKIRYFGSFEQINYPSHFKAFSVIFVFWLIVFFSHGLFELQSLRRYTGLIFNLVSAMLVNLILAIIFFYVQPDLILTPRRLLILNISITFSLLLFWYLVIKSLVRNLNYQYLYLFSFNNELNELEKEIKAHNFLGYRILGHLNLETLPYTNFVSNQAIVLPENLQSSPDTLAKFYKLRTLGVDFYNHKDFYETLLRRVYLSQINEIWFLENIDYKEKRIFNLVKRILDLILGFLGMLIFVLTFPFIAILIKITSRGPVLFIQERVGIHGKTFRVFKYRTMKTGTETKTWTSVNDSRITTLGKILRITHLDELPQFINLILGNMSLVGPRPEQSHIVENLKKQIPFYDERHLVKPGLTGWAQLNVYASSLEESKLKLQYDLYYIKNRSLLFDLEIILKTIYYIFTWKGR